VDAVYGALTVIQQRLLLQHDLRLAPKLKSDNARLCSVGAALKPQKNGC
jgi:hypothetical protein